MFKPLSQNNGAVYSLYDANGSQQGEHVFDVNAEPEPEPEEDDCPDFDADYEEGLGDCEERSKEHKEGCEATVSGKGR